MGKGPIDEVLNSIKAGSGILKRCRNSKLLQAIPNSMYAWVVEYVGAPRLLRSFPARCIIAPSAEIKGWGGLYNNRPHPSAALNLVSGKSIDGGGGGGGGT